MLISIVTAVWNRADTIGQALASVQSQTHREIEHIVQDGASTDGTLAAIAARPDPRIHLVSKTDTGLYDALNRGLARTTGEIVGLVHSDDYLAAPDILARVAEAFADPAVDAVYGDLDYIAADAPPSERPDKPTGPDTPHATSHGAPHIAPNGAPQPARILRRWRSGPFHPALLARGWMPPHPTLYLRRRVLEQHGPFDTSFRIAADYDAVLRYFSQPGFRARHLPHVFTKMRMGGASNASLRHILLKSREDYRALRKNRIGGPAGAFTALAAKNLGKLGQFTRGGTQAHPAAPGHSRPRSAPPPLLHLGSNTSASPSDTLRKDPA